jgi:site-specific recombinase XerD
MKRHAFLDLLQRFFAEHLASQRGLSNHTIIAYRDTFRLLLTFLATHRREPVDRLSLIALSPEMILAFLDHLESVRGNGVRTRNVRLAAIRSFARFAVGQTTPDLFPQGHRILAIPLKRAPKPLMGFMTREEIDAILTATNPSTWSGRRDHLLFSFLYNTGARISEALHLRPADIQDRSARLHGKGRKERQVPLWSQTARELRQWCRSNQIGADQPVFTSQRGAPLSHDGAAYRLTLAVRKAELTCLSLRGKKVTPHMYRHSTAMAMLQAGVALEVIALFLGHESPLTTHGYVEADMKMKADCLQRLDQPPPARRQLAEQPSRILAFLRAL